MHDDVSLPGASSSAADLGGPEAAGPGQALEDLKRKKSRAESRGYGTHGGTVGAEVPVERRTSVPQIHARIEVRNLNPVIRPSSLRPTMPLDTQDKLLGIGVPQTHGRPDAGAGRQRYRPRDPFIPDKPNIKDYESPESEVLDVSRSGLLGSETHRTQGLVPQLHTGKAGKYLGRTNPPPQDRTYPPPQDPRPNLLSTSQRQETRDPLFVQANRQDEGGAGAKDKIRPKIRDRYFDPSSTTRHLGAEEQEFTDATDFSRAEPKRESDPLHVPRRAGEKTHMPSKRKEFTSLTVNVNSCNIFYFM